MGRAKIARKSTSIDMTAMCDVAFLLLSFFILATKQKPPEAVAVNAPTSVSSKAVIKESILITLTKEGKVFLMLGDDTKKREIVEKVNANRQLGLSEAELNKLTKLSYIGMPLNEVKGMLNLGRDIPANKMKGIPIGDSTNNELVHWMRGIVDAYAGTNQRDLEEKIIVKGDNMAKYPTFKSVKYAFKQNDIYKFKIATNSETVPVGSELYNSNKGIAPEKAP